MDDLARPNEGSAAGRDRIVVLPRTPGPLRAVPDALHPDDELDAAVAEVFGDGSADKPGRTDGLLLVGGVALFAGGTIAGQGLATALGVAGIVLGVALPLEAAIRALERRRLAVRQGRVLRVGYAIDASAPETADLVKAYESLLALTDATGVAADVQRRSDDARSAAHAAVVEVATLLDGRAPDGEEQRDYVRKRTLAIQHVTRGLRRLEAGHSTRAQRDDDAVLGDGHARARIAAREQLEADAGVSGLSQLESLRRGLTEGPFDDRA